MDAAKFLQRALALILVLGLSQAASAQDPELPLARALILGLAPSDDDPDAHTQQLLRAALEAPRSPCAAALVAATSSSRYDVAAPREVLAILDAERATPKHGLLQQEIDALRNDMCLLLGKPERAVADGLARSLLAIGPFGDSGQRFLHVPFPPDSAFPDRNALLPGRLGDVRVRPIERTNSTDGFRFLTGSSIATGCHYALWRVEAVDDVEGFLEVSYGGSFSIRIDGIEVGSFENLDSQNYGRNQHWLSVRLQKGAHEIVLKTGDDSSSELWLRLCDGNGMALAQTREIAADAPRSAPAAGNPRGNATYRTSIDVFRDAAAQASGDDRAALLVAAASEAKRLRHHDDAMRLLLLLHAQPPTDAASKLALAELWNRTAEFPEEIRNSRARELQGAAVEELPELHASALAARVKKLEDQDQREQALRLLRKAIDAKRAGPRLFELTQSVMQQLRFSAELPSLHEQWRAACPGDYAPRDKLADRYSELGASDMAFQLQEEVRRTRAGNAFVARKSIEMAIERNCLDDAARIIEETIAALPPTTSTATEVAELRLRIAEARNDAALREIAMEQLRTAPRIDARRWARIAELRIAMGNDAEAIVAIDASLDLDTDQPDLRRLREALGGPKREGADFERFRRDGNAAIAAFRKGANEEGASSSLLIDQRIVELLPDGSALVEIHELRSINDLQGVDALRSADPAASADELLLLRTVGKDGKTYVPTRVEGGFSMPRLEPGAFVEWRYRDRLASPGADPLRLEDFLFASQQEALYHSEWVLITPAKGRGELRTRNLQCERETIALDGGRTATILRKTQVARLPQESSTPPGPNFQPMAGYGEDATMWPDLRGQHANLIARTRPTPVLADFAKSMFASKESDAERVTAAWQFCQKDIGDGEATNATEILLRKKGNRFLLLVALLRAGGVPMDFAVCESALESLRGEGVPLFAGDSELRVPCVRLLPRDGDEAWLFADTPRHWPLGSIPAHRSGARAAILSDASFELVRLPVVDGAVQDLQVVGECDFDPATTVLRSKVCLHGQAGFSVAEQIRRVPADRQKLAARQIAQQFLQGWRMRNASCTGLEPPGQRFEIEAEATGPAAQAAGEGRWLATLPFPTMSMRASFGDRDERTLPLQIETDLRLHHRMRLSPGEGRRFGALLPPTTHSFGPLDYQLTMTRDGDAVVAERKVRLRTGVIEPALYPDWIRVLARIDQREEQRLEILAQPSKAPAPK